MLHEKEPFILVIETSGKVSTPRQHSVSNSHDKNMKETSSFWCFQLTVQQLITIHHAYTLRPSISETICRKREQEKTCTQAAFEVTATKKHSSKPKKILLNRCYCVSLLLNHNIVLFIRLFLFQKPFSSGRYIRNLVGFVRKKRI